MSELIGKAIGGIIGQCIVLYAFISFVTWDLTPDISGATNIERAFVGLMMCLHGLNVTIREAK